MAPAARTAHAGQGSEIPVKPRPLLGQIQDPPAVRPAETPADPTPAHCSGLWSGGFFCIRDSAQCMRPVPASFFGRRHENPSFILASTLCLGVGRSPRSIWPFSAIQRLSAVIFPFPVIYFHPAAQLFGWGSCSWPGPGSSYAVTAQQPDRTGKQNRERPTTTTTTTSTAQLGTSRTQTSRPDSDRFHLLQHSKPGLDWPIHLRPSDDTLCDAIELSSAKSTPTSQPQSVLRTGPILISRPAGVSAHHSFALAPPAPPCGEHTPAQHELRTRLPCSSFFLRELPNRHGFDLSRTPTRQTAAHAACHALPEHHDRIPRRLLRSAFLPTTVFCPRSFPITPRR